jgi:hypothetical protein
MRVRNRFDGLCSNRIATSVSAGSIVKEVP